MSGGSGGRPAGPSGALRAVSRVRARGDRRCAGARLHGDSGLHRALTRSPEEGSPAGGNPGNPVPPPASAERRPAGWKTVAGRDAACCPRAYCGQGNVGLHHVSPDLTRSAGHTLMPYGLPTGRPDTVLRDGGAFFLRTSRGHWFSMMGMAKCWRLAGKPSECGYSIIDSIPPEMRSMTWNCYRSSAQRATLLSCNLIRPMPPSIMVAVSFTNVRTVLPTFPRQKRPSWPA